MAGRRKGDDNEDRPSKLSKLTKEDRRVIKLCLSGTSSSVLVMSVLAFLVFGNYLNLSGHVNDSQLWDASYYHRLEFAMRYQVIGAGWLLFSVIYVMAKRVTTRASDPLTARDSTSLTIAKNNLSNSLEQFLCSFLAQIIALSYLDETCVLKVIPLVNLFFLIGRVGFLLGYPTYRDFGICCSFFPTTFLMFYNSYAFLRFLFL